MDIHSELCHLLSKRFSAWLGVLEASKKLAFCCSDALFVFRQYLPTGWGGNDFSRPTILRGGDALDNLGGGNRRVNLTGVKHGMTKGQDAIAIVGGLLVSQVLTLYTTPAIYLSLARLRRRTAARWRQPPTTGDTP